MGFRTENALWTNIMKNSIWKERNAKRSTTEFFVKERNIREGYTLIDVIRKETTSMNYPL